MSLQDRNGNALLQTRRHPHYRDDADHLHPNGPDLDARSTAAIFRRPRGLCISYPCREELDTIMANVPQNGTGGDRRHRWRTDTRIG
jgi:hypothetical protein